MAALDDRRWNKQLRELRRQERVTAANYVLSLLHDCAYVRRCVDAAPGMPVLANLRAGAWYVAPTTSDERCYFKSTDGHAGTWGFSLSRLNWHVLERAAACSAVLIVDATRRGKRYPDSLSKTVPVWCAVLNAAAQRLGAPALPAGEGELRLPEWVPPSEAAQVRAHIAGWAEALVGVCTAQMRATLTSALAGRALVPEWCCPPELPQPLAPADEAARGPIRVVCLSASEVVSHARSRELRSWAYIQGAGDDDEAWTRGLTPTALFAHAHALERAAWQDAAVCEQLVDELRARNNAALGAGARGAGAGEHAAGDGARPAAAAASVGGGSGGSAGSGGGGLVIVGATGLAMGGWEEAAAALSAAFSGAPGSARAPPSATPAAVFLGSRAECDALAAGVAVGGAPAGWQARQLCALEACAQRSPTTDWWVSHLLPRALRHARRALRELHALPAAAPAADGSAAASGASAQRWPFHLALAHGASVPAEHAVAMTVALLTGLYAERGVPTHDPRGAQLADAGRATELAFSAHCGSALDTRALSKQTIRARHVALQAACGTAGMAALPRTLQKQLNRFFLSAAGGAVGSADEAGKPSAGTAPSANGGAAAPAHAQAADLGSSCSPWQLLVCRRGDADSDDAP